MHLSVAPSCCRLRAMANAEDFSDLWNSFNNNFHPMTYFKLYTRKKMQGVIFRENSWKFIEHFSLFLMKLTLNYSPKTDVLPLCHTTNQHEILNSTQTMQTSHRRHFWHATHDCVAPYVDTILHRERFWAKSAASGSVRWCCFRSCWTVLSHVMRGRPSCLLQSSTKAKICY